MADSADDRGCRQGSAGQIRGAIGRVNTEHVGKLLRQSVIENAQNDMYVLAYVSSLETNLQVGQVVGGHGGNCQRLLDTCLPEHAGLARITMNEFDAWYAGHLLGKRRVFVVIILVDHGDTQLPLRKPPHHAIADLAEAADDEPVALLRGYQWNWIRGTGLGEQAGSTQCLKRTDLTDDRKRF